MGVTFQDKRLIKARIARISLGIPIRSDRAWPNVDTVLAGDPKALHLASGDLGGDFLELLSDLHCAQAATLTVTIYTDEMPAGLTSNVATSPMSIRAAFLPSMSTWAIQPPDAQ